VIQQQAFQEVYAWVYDGRQGPLPQPPMEYSDEQRTQWWEGYYAALEKHEQEEQDWIRFENFVVAGVKAGIVACAVGIVLVATMPIIQVGAALVGLYVIVKSM
jgi:hypothetical protein